MLKISDNAKGAVLMGVLALVYLMEGLELDYGTANMPREGFIPLIVGLVLLACCVVLFAQEVLFRNKEQKDDAAVTQDNEEDNFCIKKPFYLTVALLFYPLLLPYLGFLMLTPVLLFVAFRIFNYRTWLWSAIVAVVATAITYGVFEKWLVVLLFPKGIWG